MLSATSLSISTEPNAFPFDELDHTDDRATSSSESLDSPATIERRLQPQERSGSNISSINISEFTRVSLNAQHLAHGCRHQDVGHPPSPRARHSLHDLEKVDDDMSNWDQNLSLDHDQHAHACRVIFQTPQSPSHSHHASLADLEEAHLNRTSDYSVQSPTHAQSIETSVPMSRSAPSHCAHEATPSSLEPDPSHDIAHDDSPSCDYQDSGSYNIDSKASYPDPSSYCESGYFSDSHSHPYHNGNATSTPRIFEFNHDTRHTVASYDLTPSSSASSSSSWDSSASDIEEPDLVDIHIQVKIHREHDRIFCSRGTEEWEIHGPELESELEASNSGSSWAREGLGFVDSKRVRAGKGRRDFTASPAHMLPRLSCLSRVRPGQGQGKYGKVSQESSTPDVGQASVSAHACARFEQTIRESVDGIAEERDKIVNELQYVLDQTCSSQDKDQDPEGGAGPWMDHYVTRKFVIGCLGEAYALQFTEATLDQEASSNPCEDSHSAWAKTGRLCDRYATASGMKHQAALDALDIMKQCHLMIGTLSPSSESNHQGGYFDRQAPEWLNFGRERIWHGDAESDVCAKWLIERYRRGGMIGGMSDILMDFKDGLLTDVGVSKSTFDNDYFVRAFAIRSASLVANFGRSSTFGISNVKTEMTNVSRAWSQYIMVKSFASALNTFPSRSSSNVALTRLFRSFAASLMLDERYVAEFYLCDWFGVGPRGLDGHRDLEEFLRESFDDDRSGSSGSEIYSDGGMWCWEGERVGGEYGLRDDIEGLISSLRAF